LLLAVFNNQQVAQVNNTIEFFVKGKIIKGRWSLLFLSFLTRSPSCRQRRLVWLCVSAVYPSVHSQQTWFPLDVFSW